MKKTKVCHLTSAHSRSDGRIFYKECVSLVNAGYDVSFVVADGLGNEEKNGIHIYDAGKPSNRLMRMILSGKHVYKKALELNCQIYHFHDPELLPQAIKLSKKGKRVIYDMHEDYPLNIMTKMWLPSTLRSIVSFLYVKYENFALKYIDTIITVTPQMEQRLTTASPIVMVTNYPLLKSVSTNIDNEYINRENVLCFAGTINHVRLHHLLFQAIENIQDVTYYLAGATSDYLEKLKTLPAWNKVVYFGVISREKVSELYSKTKIGIVIEEYGLVNYGAEGSLGVTKLFEYMQNSLPFICTDFKYHKSIVEKYKCGLCINPNNVSEISAAITYLLDNPLIAKEMGENGYKAFCENYNWSSQEIKLINLYNDCSMRIGK